MIHSANAALVRHGHDDDWISMEDRLGRRLGTDSALDDNCFPMARMIDWAADSDPNSVTTGFRWMIIDSVCQ